MNKRSLCCWRVKATIRTEEPTGSPWRTSSLQFMDLDQSSAGGLIDFTKSITRQKRKTREHFKAERLNKSADLLWEHFDPD